MLRARVIPLLLLQGTRLVKTTRFRDPKYVGDPINTAKIFCEKQVDELIVIDINASRDGQEPNFELLEQLATECFMPITYGGGVRSVEIAQRIISLGIEKVAINSAARRDIDLIKNISNRLGSQSVVGVIDYKRNIFGQNRVFDHIKKTATSDSIIKWAQNLINAGAGEILINSVERDGTRCGMDNSFITAISSSISVPLLSCGGAGSLEDIAEAVKAGAAGVCAGSLFVYHGPHKAVLINYPNQSTLAKYIGEVQ